MKDEKLAELIVKVFKLKEEKFLRGKKIISLRIREHS